MFQEYYGFSSLPFSKTMATKDLFVTAAQQELGARLTYLVRERGVGLLHPRLEFAEGIRRDRLRQVHRRACLCGHARFQPLPGDLSGQPAAGHQRSLP